MPYSWRNNTKKGFITCIPYNYCLILGFYVQSLCIIFVQRFADMHGFSTLVSHVKAEIFIFLLRCHVCVRLSTMLKTMFFFEGVFLKACQNKGHLSMMQSQTLTTKQQFALLIAYTPVYQNLLKVTACQFSNYPSDWKKKKQFLWRKVDLEEFYTKQNVIGRGRRCHFERYTY